MVDMIWDYRKIIKFDNKYFSLISIFWIICKYLYIFLLSYSNIALSIWYKIIEKIFKIENKFFNIICIFWEIYKSLYKFLLSYSDSAWSIWLEMIDKILKINKKYFSLICIFWVFKRHVKILMPVFVFRIVDFYKIHIEISIIKYMLKSKGVC